VNKSAQPNKRIAVKDACLHSGHTVPNVFTGTSQLNAAKVRGIEMWLTDLGIAVKSANRTGSCAIYKLHILGS